MEETGGVGQRSFSFSGGCFACSAGAHPVHYGTGRIGLGEKRVPYHKTIVLLRSSERSLHETETQEPGLLTESVRQRSGEVPSCPWHLKRA